MGLWICEFRSLHILEQPFWSSKVQVTGIFEHLYMGSGNIAWVSCKSCMCLNHWVASPALTLMIWSHCKPKVCTTPNTVLCFCYAFYFVIWIYIHFEDEKIGRLVVQEELTPDHMSGEYRLSELNSVSKVEVKRYIMLLWEGKKGGDSMFKQGQWRVALLHRSHGTVLRNW